MLTAFSRRGMDSKYSIEFWFDLLLIPTSYNRCCQFVEKGCSKRGLHIDNPLNCEVFQETL
jgi:hypothetical protein